MKNNLKVHRAVKNLTQAQLAKKIGVSRQTINAIESQNYVPSTKLALKLSQEFNISVNDIFTLRDQEVNTIINQEIENEVKVKSQEYLWFNLFIRFVFNINVGL